MRTPAVFGAKRKGGERAQATLPQAIRPAVEIIARLSSERARLRAELSRLRAGNGSDSSLQAELAQVKAERDALRAEVERLRTAKSSFRTTPAAATEAQPSPALRRLVDRLERSLTRLETATHGVEQISGQFDRAAAPVRAAPVRAAPVPARTRRERNTASAPRSPLSGNGMMATLLRDNLSLRGAENRTETTRATRPTPGAAGGGGMLGALAQQNAELRESIKSPRRTGRPALANPLAGLVAENKALRRVSRRVDMRIRAA